jgi:hypothetical protein
MQFTDNQIKTIQAREIVLEPSFKSIDETRLEGLNKQLDESIDALNCFVSENDVKLTLQGWHPTADDQAIGHWDSVASEPQDITIGLWLLPSISKYDAMRNEVVGLLQTTSP